VIDYLKAFAVSFVAMIVLDAVWLGFIAPNFYKKHIGFILADNPNWFAAALFYVIFIIGVTVFVVYPAWKNKYSLTKIGLLGSLLGLVAYATYDLTNLATLQDWPIIVTVVDLIWGSLLTAAVSLSSVLILNKFAK
jgi:uncharacterized membrane protein